MPLQIKDQATLFTTVADTIMYVTANMTKEERMKIEIVPTEVIPECTLGGKSCGSL